MSKQRSNDQSRFAQVPRAEIPRSSFDRSHGHKTTFDAGYLVPIFVDEALPGDTFNLSMTGFARLATPIYPIMDNLYMDTFFFAVPIRLLWANFKRFMGERPFPEASIDYTVPRVQEHTVAALSLGDYFGIPTGFPIRPNELHYRAYNLIWNEWFRDQNLQDPAIVVTGDAGQPVASYPLRRRGKRHDYFTSALPWPQKGDAVDIPLGTTAPVVPDTIGRPEWETPLGNSRFLMSSTPSAGPVWNAAIPTGDNGFVDWKFSGLEVDLSSATAATINTLRQAFQIQRLLERDARGGTRYTELVRAHFGVTSPDARLQRPEYLGGGSSPVNISPIHQTESTQEGSTPLGQLGAIGTATLHNHGFTQSFTEHCVIIGLISVRADLNYQQGLHRMWSRQTRYDFFWPALSHIGEQAVLNKEIVYTNTGTDEDVFGYQERFAEYRYKPSQITGLFRSQHPQSLDAWHLAQEFVGAPPLADTFIQDNPPIDRVIAVPSEPHFLFDAFFSLRCARPMPTYGVPGLIDHF